MIDGGTGSWMMKSNVDGSAAADLKNGYGLVYGTNAEAIGGVWGIKATIADDYQHATGIFYSTGGSRHVPTVILSRAVI